MEGAPRAPFALRLLLLAVLPAAVWLTTGPAEPPPAPGAPKVGQGGRSSSASAPRPSAEARAGAVGLRRPRLPASLRWPAGHGLGSESPEGQWGGAVTEMGREGPGGGRAFETGCLVCG